MNPIGFSVPLAQQSDFAYLEAVVTAMKAAGCEAIELNVPFARPVPPVLPPLFVQAFRAFRFRSIHLPELTNPEADASLINAYQTYIAQLRPAALALHPHTTTGWRWLEGPFGGLLAIENMDSRKPFGTTVAHLKQVFTELPTSRWVYDVNHAATVNPNFATGGWYETFAPRLAYYQISGFTDELPHTALHRTGQGHLLAAVRDSRPIILESLGSGDIHEFKPELAYVRRSLERTGGQRLLH